MSAATPQDSTERVHASVFSLQKITTKKSASGVEDTATPDRESGAVMAAVVPQDTTERVHDNEIGDTGAERLGRVLVQCTLFLTRKKRQGI